MKAFIFPGQGSQKRGMGEGLFELFPVLTKKADTILGYSIKDLCLLDNQNALNLTQYTQPALYVINALMYYKKIQESKYYPDYLAGHSLGEYSALLAGGAFDFETGLRLVKKRAELMSRVTDGGMAAIIGIDGERIKEILEKNGFNTIDVANFNSPSQTVISGLKEDIDKAENIFIEAGAKLYFPLPVSGAFHSQYMEPARKEFELFLQEFEFSDLTTPVISNVEARYYTREKIKHLLASQITHSVKWTESIRYLMGKNVEEFIEIGPGRVLTKLVIQIQQESEPLIILSEAHLKESKALGIKREKKETGGKE